MNWRGRWFAEAQELSAGFWIYFSASLCFDVGFSTYVFLYNLFLLDIGFDERRLGLVTGAMTAGVMLGTLPAGALANRFGLKRLLLSSFVLTPLICAVRPFFPNLTVQIVLAMLTGLALSQWQVCFSPVTAALTSEKSRTFAFSLMFSTGIGLGALGGLLGGWLPGFVQRVNPAVVAAGAKRTVLVACCLVYALGAWPAWKLKLQRTNSGPARVWRFDPFLYRFLPAVALWSLAAGAFVPFAQVFLARQAHLPLVRIGQAFAAGQIVEVVAVLLAPAFFRRCGLAGGIAYTQAGAGLVLAGLAYARGPSRTVTLYVAFVAIHWMSGPGIYSLLMGRVQEGARSAASAVNNFTTSLCQALMSPIAGAAYVRFGYPEVMTAVAGMAVLSSLVFRALLVETALVPGEARVVMPARES